MSIVSLERSRIRLLKLGLRDALEQRVAARLVLARAQKMVAEGLDWRTPEILSSDWPSLQETTRFLRGISSHLRSPLMALTRFESLLHMDEAHIRRQLGELTACMLLTESARVKDEFTAFWSDVCLQGQGPDASDVFSAARKGEAPPLPDIQSEVQVAILEDSHRVNA